MRKRKCKVCGEEFSPRRAMQPTCDDYKCMVAYAQSVAERLAARRVSVQKRAERIQRAEDRAKREAMKTTQQLKREAQAAFNAWIRYRDLSAGHPCICCGKPFEPEKFGGSVDAGHYLSRGSHPNLAFDERNVHAQRKSCNRPGGTTAAAFREGMIKRIGLEAVEALEADNTPRRYRAEDYRMIRDEYRKKLADAKKRDKEKGV